MCGHEQHRGCDQGPFAEGREAMTLGRRGVLKAASGLVFSSALGAGLAGAGGASGAWAADPQAGVRHPRPSAAALRRRAYVLVLDGCRPEEIDEGLMPTVKALRDGGLRFPRAVSNPIMETIPNHVMMMTGYRPDRTGVPANAIYDRRAGEVRTMERATDIKCDDLLSRMRRHGFTTGSVLSKEYLYGVFGERATHRWEPAPIIPVSGHAPDVFTMRAALDMVEEFDPHLTFVNLGDIDRFGHTDFTGAVLSIEALRRTALIDTDRLVGEFVDMLRSTGRWEHSIVIVLADHSMDWSVPGNVITMTPALEADPFLAGKVQVGQNGGAELVYWTGPARDRARAITRIRAIADATDGVLSSHDRVASRRHLRLGPEAGDVVLYCKAGWRFSDPERYSNPIPGNHGHPTTRPIPFFVAGGHPVVPQGVTRPTAVSTVDVTPTVSRFFGLRPPTRGWDGTSRL